MPTVMVQLSKNAPVCEITMPNFDAPEFKNECKFVNIADIRAQLRKEIDAQPLTKKQRDLEYESINARAREAWLPANQQYNDREAQIRIAFWNACREHYGYGHWTLPIITIMEERAWANGHTFSPADHANGFQEVFNCLDSIVDAGDQGLAFLE